MSALRRNAASCNGKGTLIYRPPASEFESCFMLVNMGFNCHTTISSLQSVCDDLKYYFFSVMSNLSISFIRRISIFMNTLARLISPLLVIYSVSSTLLINFDRVLSPTHLNLSSENDSWKRIIITKDCNYKFCYALLFREIKWMA